MFEIKELPADIERCIVTPHDHEGDKNPPLWLIWKVQKGQFTGVPYFPQLDTVCNSEDLARYHVRAILFDNVGTEVYVERIPANHRFGSSLDDLQMKTHMALWKERLKRVDGD